MVPPNSPFDDDLGPIALEVVEASLPWFLETSDEFQIASARIDSLIETFVAFRKAWPRLGAGPVEEAAKAIGESLPVERKYADQAWSQHNAYIAEICRRLDRETPTSTPKIPDEALFAQVSDWLRTRSDVDLYAATRAYSEQLQPNFDLFRKNLQVNDQEMGKLVRLFESEATDIYYSAKAS